MAIKSNVLQFPTNRKKAVSKELVPVIKPLPSVMAAMYDLNDVHRLLTETNHIQIMRKTYPLYPFSRLSVHKDANNNLYFKYEFTMDEK